MIGARVRATIARLGLGPPSEAGAELSGRDLGRRGEKLAARYLRTRGYRVLERNVRTPIGEVDLLCTAPGGRAIVLVEVKSRLTDAAGSGPPPEASITEHKRRKLRALARDLAKRRGWESRPMRIDVVAVEMPSRGARPVIRHHESAVMG